MHVVEGGEVQLNSETAEQEEEQFDLASVLELGSNGMSRLEERHYSPEVARKG